MSTIAISIKSSSMEYELKIGKNILNELFKHLAMRHKGKRAAIITDENVSMLYGASLSKGIAEAGLWGRLIAVKPGEKSKSLETLAEVYAALADFNISRGDIIIALGGGVVGDLAGFAAATYLRGIPYIQLPTTLLSQVDSSVGGKTAIDLPVGKNLVGSFYHPEIVFIDTMFLKTLDERYIKDGMAEVIKYGCIKDEKLFSRLQSFESMEQCIDDMNELVHICCSIKKSVVEVDERDRGERLLLNFGHTLGHAIEQYYNYESFTHGEAVAIGMAEITRLSEAAGLTEKGTAEAIEAALRKYGLPYNIPVTDKKELVKAIRHDKKSLGDRLRIILLNRLGSAFIREIKSEELESFVLGVQ